MRVKAKHNINLSGVWHMGGEVFEISTTDADALGDMIEIAETPLDETISEEAPKKRTRTKKND